MQFQRTAVGQRQNIQACSPSAMEKKIIWARPIEILERHVAHRRQHPAVGRVVAVVAHHEEVARRHGVDDGVVVEAVVDAIERLIADAVRQRLLPALDPRGGVGPAGILADEIAQALAHHRLVVDVEQPFLHLDAVAGQPDHALDVVGGVVLRQAEHDDVAARRLGAEDAPRKQRRRQRNRIVAVAVGIFRDEQIVADQQRRLHRSRGDVEGLEQEGADHQRDQQSMDDDADGFTQAAFRFCPGCHAHRFPNSPSRFPRGGRAFSSRESLFASRQENGLDSDVESEFRRKPEFALARIPCGVLDGCSQPRNQRPHQNLLIH